MKSENDRSHSSKDEQNEEIFFKKNKNLIKTFCIEFTFSRAPFFLV